jgi:hypothetical protein
MFRRSSIAVSLLSNTEFRVGGNGGGGSGGGGSGGSGGGDDVFGGGGDTKRYIPFQFLGGRAGTLGKESVEGGSGGRPPVGGSKSSDAGTEGGSCASCPMTPSVGAGSGSPGGLGDSRRNGGLLATVEPLGEDGEMNTSVDCSKCRFDLAACTWAPPSVTASKFSSPPMPKPGSFGGSARAATPWLTSPHPAALLTRPANVWSPPEAIANSGRPAAPSTEFVSRVPTCLKAGVSTAALLVAACLA